MWVRAVAVSPGLQDAYDRVAARIPASLKSALGAGGATFFPNSHTW